MHKILLLSVMVTILNLPFGFWRESARKFSFTWFIAVHAPVPIVVGLRLLSGLGWHLESFPLLVSAYLVGQYSGGVLRRNFACYRHR